VTNARLKIANYHFTTLSPNLGVVDLDDHGFVIADIPGLIEGAADGVGLGHEFLRHIERTKVLIHLIDAAGTEGRDPVEDLRAINRELSLYEVDLSGRPQVIAANKMDVLNEEERAAVLKRLHEECDPSGTEIYPISAATGEGVKELLYAVDRRLSEFDAAPTVFAQEYDPDVMLAFREEPYTVYYDEEEEEYVIEGPKIEKMLGYTNLESEKGFAFFQKFLKENGMLEQLEALGIQDGDTVRMYGHSFDYYR
jgi:GTP-binding protein